MTVRAADHRDNTSVRVGGLTLLPSALADRAAMLACLPRGDTQPCALPGAAVAGPGRDTRRPTTPEGVDDDDEPDEDRDRTGQEGTW
jgi:hypothetical protein